MAEIVPPILMLNNDCLLKIFAYLDVVQLIELESVCRRFADVIQVEYKRRRGFVYKEYEEAYGDRFKSVKVVQKMFERIGPNLQRLDLNWKWTHPEHESLSQKLVTMLQYSEKLEYLRLDYASYILLDSRSVDLLEERSPNLKTLVISGSGGRCFVRLNLNKNNNQFLREASNLEILRLEEVNLCGKWYSWLPKLKEASFHNCGMDFRDMKSFINCHNSLEVLELTYTLTSITNINYEDRLDAITANLMNLKRFSFILLLLSSSSRTLSVSNLKTIANLPQLTDLHVSGCQPIKELLEALAERNILERLYIGEDMVSKEMLLPLRKFRNLKSLTIKCRYLKEKFYSTLPLEHKLEYLDLFSFNAITADNICFLAQHGVSLKTVGISYSSSLGLESKYFADKIQPFLRDRLHPLTLEVIKTFEPQLLIPEVNIPGLKICKANRSFWPPKPLRFFN